jgi:transcriptional regulator with XRE-family HTH domain
MPDELRNSRTVHNRLSSQLLYRLMDFRGWTELKLAEMSGIFPNVVSANLSGKRSIRPQHLAAYLGVLDRQERVAFLAAWLRDNVGYEVIANLLDGTKTRSMSSVPENQCRMLDWWATAIASDSKFAKIFTRFNTKAGLKFPSVLLLPVSTAAAQLQSLLLEKASSIGISYGPCVLVSNTLRSLSLRLFWLCASRARYLSRRASWLRGV